MAEARSGEAAVGVESDVSSFRDKVCELESKLTEERATLLTMSLFLLLANWSVWRRSCERGGVKQTLAQRTIQLLRSDQTSVLLLDVRLLSRCLRGRTVLRCDAS